MYLAVILVVAFVAFIIWDQYRLSYRAAKKRFTHTTNDSDYDALLWQTKNLAKLSLDPFCNEFPEYEPVYESNMENVWTILMTISLMNVAAKKIDIIDDKDARNDIIKALNNEYPHSGDLFKDCYSFVLDNEKKYNAPWTGTTAFWMVLNLKSHQKANNNLKINAERVEFVNQIGGFLNISYGNPPELGISHFLNEMEKKGLLEQEKDKAKMIVHLFQVYIQETLKRMAE